MQVVVAVRQEYITQRVEDTRFISAEVIGEEQIAEITAPTALFLSTVARFGHSRPEPDPANPQPLHDTYRWFYLMSQREVFGVLVAVAADEVAQAGDGAFAFGVRAAGEMFIGFGDHQEIARRVAFAAVAEHVGEIRASVDGVAASRVGREGLR